LRKLPVDARGYPVPWFVAWVPGPDGVNVPEFRAADARKFTVAVKLKLCWICGEPLGRWLAFPIGPMCAITRTTAEPPCHVECAEWSIRNCPFLSQPRQVRRDGDLPDGITQPAGRAIVRNPGVTCLWVTREYELFDDGHGKPLIHVGKLERASWWCEGRAATHADVEASMESGLPILIGEAKREGKFALEALERQYAGVKAFLPAVTAPEAVDASDPHVTHTGTPGTRE
jgi:hypothetical protein